MKTKINYLNRFTLFCLIGGTILGFLNGMGNLNLMIIQGLFGGILFYLIGVYIENNNILTILNERNDE